ncbi:bifunctional diguanylate cyclase/phosphodiesterase [Paludibacterium yongneupense]|uniref:bifunctional diguanylate cyclase/phosphodiesterase n=1 Tax=Paludibacterium yongneupense TaxID=400061 RepID=UPI000409544D|nr:LapD/MoxY N-terminal periplasmic domain-containing protein [Paludibacterium yongneupense]
MNRLSLVQRLWILLSVAMLAVAGALATDLLAARHYIEQQLGAQNTDTANGLALMITQYKAEPAMAETLINAAFDQGHYHSIRWLDADGKPRIERINRDQTGHTPGWFARLLPLQPPSGNASVSKGWLQAGQISVDSDLGFAYVSLWEGAAQTLAWLAVVGLLSATVGSISILQLRTHLNRMVEQADAIAEQRFIRIPEPPTPELSRVVAAMNRMVGTLQRHLQASSAELERLRRETLTDAATGLPNRVAFLQQLNALLGSREQTQAGELLLLRVANLTELNQRLGGAATDALLDRLAADLRALAHPRKGWLAARLRGADFALLCPEIEASEALTLAQSLCNQLASYQQMGLVDCAGLGHIGLSCYHSGDSADALLLRVNQALAEAGTQPANHFRRSDRDLPQQSEHDWLQLIVGASKEKRLRLDWYPVNSPAGVTLWREGMLYLPDGDGKINALRLVSHALRLGISAQLDLAALHQAVLESGRGLYAINVSPASLADGDFLPAIEQAIRHLARQSLTFEFHETGLAEHWDAFTSFCDAVRRRGQRVAVEIAGNDLELVARLYEIGIAYLVIDSGLTLGIHHDPGRQALLRGLLRMSGLMNIALVAKGVQNADDAASLVELGIDAMTGTAIH